MNNTENNHFGLETFSETNIKKLSFLSDNLIKIIECHRGFNDFDINNLDKYYLYTGRGPSMDSFHIGHLLGLELILEFQKYIGSKIYFMIADDEKMIRDKIKICEMKKNVDNTIKQLEKIGFNDSNTNIKINSNGIDNIQYQLLIKLMSLVTLNKLEHIFGKKDNVGEYFYVFVQLLPCFIENKQCIIIAGKDQDPFFRLARELATKMSFNPPIIIYTKNVPALDGSDKMSSSSISSIPIFLTDKEQEIKNKIFMIKKVGAGTLDELFEQGANLQIDIPYKLIELFDKNKMNVDIIKKYYEKAQNICDCETDIEIINSLVGDKGIKIKNNLVVITTFGVRTYLTKVIIDVIKKYNI